MPANAVVRARIDEHIKEEATVVLAAFRAAGTQQENHRGHEGSASWQPAFVRHSR